MQLHASYHAVVGKLGKSIMVAPCTFARTDAIVVRRHRTTVLQLCLEELKAAWPVGELYRVLHTVILRFSSRRTTPQQMSILTKISTTIINRPKVTHSCPVKPHLHTISRPYSIQSQPTKTLARFQQQGKSPPKLTHSQPQPLPQPPHLPPIPSLHPIKLPQQPNNQESSLRKRKLLPQTNPRPAQKRQKSPRSLTTLLLPPPRPKLQRILAPNILSAVHSVHAKNYQLPCSDCYGRFCFWAAA